MSGCEWCMAVAGEAHPLINLVAKFANRLSNESDHKNLELTFLLCHHSKHNKLVFILILCRKLWWKILRIVRNGDKLGS